MNVNNKHETHNSIWGPQWTGGQQVWNLITCFRICMSLTMLEVCPNMWQVVEYEPGCWTGRKTLTVTKGVNQAIIMFANKLKLNPDKTEFILIGSRKNRNQLLPHFPPAQGVRNLGVVFDSNFTFSNHVSQVIKSTRVQARDLYRIRPLLDLNTSVLLANALVSSRLDYCNSLFLSLTDFELRRLQLVQNSL